MNKEEIKELIETMLIKFEIKMGHKIDMHIKNLQERYDNFYNKVLVELQEIKEGANILEEEKEAREKENKDRWLNHLDQSANHNKAFLDYCLRIEKINNENLKCMKKIAGSFKNE